MVNRNDENGWKANENREKKSILISLKAFLSIPMNFKSFYCHIT